jgi:hypothetical protein
MAFDYKKEYKEFYMPKSRPEAIDVPPMNFISVRGKGDPNEQEGEYMRALEMLYSVAYTIRMSHKSGHEIAGFFDYVVPPLEGLWWIEGLEGMDYGRKSDLNWISMIRLPDFVNMEELDWAKEHAEEKKSIDVSKVKFMTYHEGLCVQCMHVGPYDDEPTTVRMMSEFVSEKGYMTDLNDVRRHHEIYLSDARKSDPSKLKTVIRHPIRLQ